MSDKLTKTPGFYAATRDAKRVMLLDLGFLGDSIHLLPALWVLRQSYPDAELHVMVSEHVTKIMEVAPWIDRIWGYPRFPRGPKWYQDFGRVRQLRTAKFDVVVNLNGSDRSSILTGLSGARWRLGRRPEDGGPAFWSAMFTHIVEHPYKAELISTQRWQCLRKAGFPGEKPEVRIEIPADAKRRALEKAGGDGGWIHVSPFTTVNYRELSFEQMAGFLSTLNQTTKRRIILTCAGNERERSRMSELLGRLDFAPWRVFCGDLDLLEYAAIVSMSSLHLGGDSGGNHVAWMSGVPSVTWYRDFEGLSEWILQGEDCMAFVGEQNDTGIRGIDSSDLLLASIKQLQKR
ncbi:MAG: glycosyltransferase family 9 protein [Chthoniobacterales bacterium]|nr:glycosyltransferase family 9 protein [Chthoniobacterales bacterium]